MKKQLSLPIILFLISQIANPSIALKYSYSFERRVMNSLKQPVFRGNFSKVQEVLVGEYAITSADSSKPVLATYGLGPCVSLAGYDKKNHVAFLTHYRTTSHNINWSYEKLINELVDLTGYNARFELTFIGGQEDYSEELIDDIESKIDSESRLELVIHNEDLLNFKSTVSWSTVNRSLAIDSRTGKIFFYDTNLNPDKRTLSEINENIFSNFFPDKLIYKPRDSL